MADSPKAPGTVAWTDLTVANADAVRQFYEAVTGWTSTPLDMGGYSDFCMARPADGEVVAGICHARGTNASLPPQWLIYIVVDDLEARLRRCTKFGGTVLFGPKEMGEHDHYAVIRDPAGAVAALFEPGPSEP